MAYQNFKPEIWSNELIMARDTKAIAVPNSWRQFEGDIKKGGEIVHIQGLVGATLKDLPADGVLADAEVIQDSSMEMIVDQKRYFNFKVDDIDKIQSNVDVMSSIMTKTGNDYAVEQDKYVYGLMLAAASKVQALTSASASNIVSAIGLAMAYIQTYSDEDIILELHPYIYNLVWQAVIAVQTPNPTVVSNGFRGSLGGANTYVSRCLTCTSDATGITPVAAGTASAYYHCFLRTGSAVAFAEQKSMSMKAYEIEKGFGEGVKGYGLYTGKVIRPLEVVELRVQI